MNRPLTDLEHVFWLFDQGKSQNFVMVASLANVTEAFNEPVLRQALDILQDRHPALKCKFAGVKVPKYTSEGVPRIPLNIIKRKSDQHWIEMTEKEIEEQFPWTTGPLVRVKVLKSEGKCDILFTFCHIIADATAGVKVVKEVLTYADKLPRGETITPGPPLPELPATHDMIRKDLKFPPEFLDIPGRIQKLFYKPVQLQGDQEVSHEKRVTRVIQRELSPTEAKALIVRARKENASVHGALCAALLQTVVEEIKKSQNVPKKRSLRIGCLTPINIRHLFSTPVGDDIGNFISDAFHYQLINENTSLWAAARKVKKSINKEKKYGKDIKDVQNIGKLLTQNAAPLDILNTIAKSLPPVFVTNLGRLDIPDQFGNLTLEKIHFALSLNPAAKDGFALAVNSFRGSMTINFLYAEPYISKERAENMAESTMKRLRKAIKE